MDSSTLDSRVAKPALVHKARQLIGCGEWRCRNRDERRTSCSFFRKLQAADALRSSSSVATALAIKASSPARYRSRAAFGTMRVGLWIRSTSSARSAEPASPRQPAGDTERDAQARCDPPPMKWSDSKYGFATEEDWHGKEETQTGRDRCEAAAGW